MEGSGRGRKRGAGGQAGGEHSREGVEGAEGSGKMRDRHTSAQGGVQCMNENTTLLECHETCVGMLECACARNEHAQHAINIAALPTRNVSFSLS